MNWRDTFEEVLSGDEYRNNLLELFAIGSVQRQVSMPDVFFFSSPGRIEISDIFGTVLCTGKGWLVAHRASQVVPRSGRQNLDHPERTSFRIFGRSCAKSNGLIDGDLVRCCCVQHGALWFSYAPTISSGQPGMSTQQVVVQERRKSGSFRRFKKYLVLEYGKECEDIAYASTTPKKDFESAATTGFHGGLSTTVHSSEVK